MRFALIGDLTVLVASMASARSAFYELFVSVPYRHSARWPGPWLLPKIAYLGILATALTVAIAAALLLGVLQKPEARRSCRIVEFSAFALMLGAWLYLVADFFGSAGRFG